jgi:hypothetical protein
MNFVHLEWATARSANDAAGAWVRASTPSPDASVRPSVTVATLPPPSSRRQRKQRSIRRRHGDRRHEERRQAPRQYGERRNGERRRQDRRKTGEGA